MLQLVHFLSADVTNCGVDVLESLTCHCMSVGAGVALMVSLWRLCPTHSRGALCGLIWSWAVLGFALASPYCDIMVSSVYLYRYY